MKKSDILKEAQVNQQSNNNNNTTIDLGKIKPSDTSKVVSIVNQQSQVQKDLSDLKRNQNVNQPQVQNEIDKPIIEPVSEDFYKEMIDKLLDKIYEITYFVKKDDDPCFTLMSQEEQNNTINRYSGSNLPYCFREIRKGNLNNAYIILQNMLNENLVNQKLFRIIAENENPRISKNDFIEYIKSKKI